MIQCIFGFIREKNAFREKKISVLALVQYFIVLRTFEKQYDAFRPLCEWKAYNLMAMRAEDSRAFYRFGNFLHSVHVFYTSRSFLQWTVLNGGVQTLQKQLL